MKYHYHTDDTFTHKGFPNDQRHGSIVEALGRAMQDAPEDAIFIFERGYITFKCEEPKTEQLGSYPENAYLSEN